MTDYSGAAEADPNPVVASGESIFAVFTDHEAAASPAPEAFDGLYPMIFEGTSYREVVEVAKYAPSACNTQPWLVHSEPGLGVLCFGINFRSFGAFCRIAPGVRANVIRAGQIAKFWM